MSTANNEPVNLNQPLRHPNSAHLGKNGFDLPSVETTAEAEPSQEALDQHRIAQYVLTQKDRPIPTIEQMKAELAGTLQDTLPNIKQRINFLQVQHLSDLQRLYALHTEEYLEEARDRYLSKDDLLYLAEGENNPILVEGYNKLENLYAEARKNRCQMSVWENDIALMRYTHLKNLEPLYQKRKELEKQTQEREAREEEERKRREADFPLSIEEFHTKPKEVQQRAVMFLTLTDLSLQEKMLSEYGWAWRQVKPLQEIFQKDPVFKSEVLALRISLNVKDPRRRV